MSNISDFQTETDPTVSIADFTHACFTHYNNNSTYSHRFLRVLCACNIGNAYLNISPYTNAAMPLLGPSQQECTESSETPIRSSQHTEHS
jgi:hypothetical protein